MGIHRKQLKRQARERMALTDPKFWVVALVYLAMTTGISWLISLIPLPEGSTIQIFFQLLLMLYTNVVQFGLCLWALWTYRQMDPDLGALTQAFSVTGRVIAMRLHIYLRLLGGYLLAGMALSVPVVMVLTSNASPEALLATLLLAFAVLAAVLIAISLRYALAPYLLADRPEDPAAAHVQRSALLMQGWKKELFKLELSFLGYEIVNFILSAGVILLALDRGGLLDPNAIMYAPDWPDRCLDTIFSFPVVLLSSLITVPVSLRLLPYRAVARAGFYDARLMSLQDGDAPFAMPPL